MSSKSYFKNNLDLGCCFSLFIHLSSGVGGGGCKRTQKSFDLSKIRAKSVKIRAKAMKMFGKYLDFWANYLKIRIKMAPNVV